eukprot:TRINITY_DN2198_c0_g3_i1.p1 TRINITY_DN2198_c0_g3~~TRINITY_DN2198_c0_g3_i1.p1  ORF type:complete len:197 (-),score=44.57 TRINITY_DN2198_c0_g3_i1:46-636(-)
MMKITKRPFDVLHNNCPSPSAPTPSPSHYNTNSYSYYPSSPSFSSTPIPASCGSFSTTMMHPSLDTTRYSEFSQLKKRKVNAASSTDDDDESEVRNTTNRTEYQSDNMDDKLFEWVPRYKKSNLRASKPKDKIFNTIDVRMILAFAIEETKQTIKQQYDNALQQQLSENFQQFSTFNNDHIHRLNHPKSKLVEYMC